MLTETPQRIAALTAGVAAARLRKRPERDEWSVNEVVAHLRSCADARGDFIWAILAKDRPTLRAVNPTTWIEHVRQIARIVNTVHAEKRPLRGPDRVNR